MTGKFVESFSDSEMEQALQIIEQTQMRDRLHGKPVRVEFSDIVGAEKSLLSDSTLLERVRQPQEYARIRSRADEFALHG